MTIRQIVVWGLTGLVTLLIGVNAFFIRGLVTQIETTSQAIGALQTDVSILRGATQGLTDLRIEVAVLQSKMAMFAEAIRERKYR